MPVGRRDQDGSEPGTRGLDVKFATWLANAEGQAGWEWDRLLRRPIILPDDASQKAIKPLVRVTDRHRDVRWGGRATQKVSHEAIEPTPCNQHRVQIGLCLLGVVAQLDAIGGQRQPLLLVRKFHGCGKGHFENIQHLFARLPLHRHIGHCHTSGQGTAGREIVEVLPGEEECSDSKNENDPGNTSGYTPQGIPSTSQIQEIIAQV